MTKSPRLQTMTPHDLQVLFENEIPLTKSFGIQVTSVTSHEVRIQGDLSINRNHKNTAFGGSQYAICALACYGLFLNGVRKEGHDTNNIVIANGQIQYLTPVTADFEVVAIWSDQDYKIFFDNLAQKKKAKIQLQAQVRSNGTVCSKFTGDFVALLDENK